MASEMWDMVVGLGLHPFDLAREPRRLAFAASVKRGRRAARLEAVQDILLQADKEKMGLDTIIRLLIQDYVDG